MHHAHINIKVEWLDWIELYWHRTNQRELRIDYESRVSFLYCVCFNVTGEFLHLHICIAVYIWQRINRSSGYGEYFQELAYDKILLFKRNKYWNCVFSFLCLSEVKRRWESVQNAHPKSGTHSTVNIGIDKNDTFTIRNCDKSKNICAFEKGYPFSHT